MIGMWRNLSSRTDRCTAVRAALVACTVVGAVVAVLPTPVRADVDGAEQRCFAVAGAPGGAAIVNVTPVGASGSGNGQVISSDVRSDPPVAANVNFSVGSVDPNVAVAPIGADGQVCFQNSVPDEMPDHDSGDIDWGDGDT
jgi:hypothetical protein